jgi:hypothetical protein
MKRHEDVARRSQLSQYELVSSVKPIVYCPGYAHNENSKKSRDESLFLSVEARLGIPHATRTKLISTFDNS